MIQIGCLRVGDAGQMEDEVGGPVERRPERILLGAVPLDEFHPERIDPAQVVIGQYQGADSLTT